MEKEKPGALASKELSDVEKSEAARLMGSIKTDKKTEASRKQGPINGVNGGRPRKNLLDIPCNCGAGADTLEGHKSYCLRGMAIKRRAAEDAKKAGK